MGESWAPRTLFYAWCVVLCPLVGWSLAVFGTRGEGGIAVFVILFSGVPAALALAGARMFSRRVPETALGIILAAALGLLTWFLTLLWLASQGVFDT